MDSGKPLRRLHSIHCTSTRIREIWGHFPVRSCSTWSPRTRPLWNFFWPTTLSQKASHGEVAMFASDRSLELRSTAQRLQARQDRSDPRRRTSAPDTRERPLPSSTARSSLRQSPKPRSCHVTARSVSGSTCTDAVSLAARERSRCAFPSIRAGHDTTAPRDI